MTLKIRGEVEANNIIVLAVIVGCCPPCLGLPLFAVLDLGPGAYCFVRCIFAECFW